MLDYDDQNVTYYRDGKIFKKRLKKEFNTIDKSDHQHFFQPKGIHKIYLRPDFLSLIRDIVKQKAICECIAPK